MEKGLREYEEKLADIVEWSKSSDYRKDERLAELMTKMERQFRIPAFRNEAYEKANPDVMRVYRKISDARITL
jgi:hypothetical protein